jgi:hypothetical protein
MRRPAGHAPGPYAGFLHVIMPRPGRADLRRQWLAVSRGPGYGVAVPELNHPSESGYLLAVGDQRRPAIGRAVFLALLACAVFSVVTGPVKQVPALYDHAPWLNDPYDTAVSFAMFFVPLTIVFCLVRLLLCRRGEPLPAARAQDLLRGCQVALGVAAATVLTEWAALAAGANRPNWNAATWWQAIVLAVTTAVTIAAVIRLRQAPAISRPGLVAGDLVPDWLADAVTVAQVRSHWLGPLSRPALRVLSWADRRVFAAVRRHPLWTAAAAAMVFGAAIGAVQAISEGYLAGAALLTVALLGCGMFAFFVVAGSYIGLVRSGMPLRGVRRRALDAAVVACVAMLVALAFRDSLWWLIGSHAGVAGLRQLAELLGLAALGSFGAVFAAESLRKWHAPA